MTRRITVVVAIKSRKILIKNFGIGRRGVSITITNIEVSRRGKVLTGLGPAVARGDGTTGISEVGIEARLATNKVAAVKSAREMATRKAILSDISR